jgi:hypothetical protein
MLRARAVACADLISDAGKRVDYHEKLALRWSEQDALAAIDFVAKSTVIPPERKPALVQKIQNSPLAARPKE